MPLLWSSDNSFFARDYKHHAPNGASPTENRCSLLSSKKSWLCILLSASCLLLTAYRSQTDVFVQQLDFVALLTQFNAQQIAHREHADPRFTIDDRQVTRAN